MIQIMGVLNVTPNSYHESGRYLSRDAALQKAECLWKEGAHIIDVGGESTRPGIEPTSRQEERDRVIPVLEGIKANLPIPVSIDTYKPEIMQDAIALGVDIINDIYGLRAPGAMEVLASCQLPVVIMHMQNSPQNMQLNPQYEDVIAEITAFFEERLHACAEMGIAKERIILDPGFGFGKSNEHNLTIMKNLEKFHLLGCPILLGCSRKTTIRAILNRSVEESLAGSLALATLAVERGVSIIRTHDVAATRDAILMTHAVLQQD